MNKVIKLFHFYKQYHVAQHRMIYLNISSIEGFCDISDATSFEYYDTKHEEHFCIHNMKMLFKSVSGEYYFSKTSLDKFLQLNEEIGIGDRFEILDL